MSKIGDIYKVNSIEPPRYFQLVAFDETQLNSDVIAVFSYSGEISEKPTQQDIEQVVASGTEFFTHTVVNFGVREKLWSRIGKGKPVNCSNAQFKQAYFPGLPKPDTSGAHDDWVVWGISQEWQHIGPNISKFPQAERGEVFPAADVVYRIQNGKYPGAKYFGFGR